MPEEDKVLEEMGWLKLKGREEKEKEDVKEEDEEEEKRSFFTGPFWNESSDVRIIFFILFFYIWMVLS